MASVNYRKYSFDTLKLTLYLSDFDHLNGIYIWLQCTMFLTVFIILNFNECKYGIVCSIGGKETCHELVEHVMSKNKYLYHVLA